MRDLNINDKRPMTEKEEKWAKKLLSVLNDMPETIEVCFTWAGEVCIHNRGAIRRYCDAKGHQDNVPTIDVIYPKTHVQIDGKGSII